MANPIQKSRWDYVGLDADKNNAPFLDQHDVEGSTYLAVDTKKVYCRYNGQWYDL